MDVFGIPIQALLGQLLIGLINGSFYALLSLGLAIIFGLLNIVNFNSISNFEVIPILDNRANNQFL